MLGFQDFTKSNEFRNILESSEFKFSNLIGTLDNFTFQKTFSRDGGQCSMISIVKKIFLRKDVFFMEKKKIIIPTGKFEFNTVYNFISIYPALLFVA